VLRSVLLALALLCRPQPAGACSCVEYSLDHYAREATTVVIGTVLKTNETSSSVDYVLSIDSVFKGSAEQTIVVRTGLRSSDCTRALLGGTASWLVFITATKPPYRINACSGSREATPKVIAALTKTLGKPTQP
jgi:hypothetical protein